MLRSKVKEVVVGPDATVQTGERSVADVGVGCRTCGGGMRQSHEIVSI